MSKRSQFVSLIIIILILMSPCQLFAKEDETPSKTTSIQQPSQTEVRFDRKTLFEIKAPIASFSPEQRAKAITERIEALSKDPFLRLDELKVVELEEARDHLADRTI
jgi:hypothetical protein